MNPARIVRIIAAALVLAFALIPALPYGPVTLAIVGLIVGWFVAAENRTTLLLMVAALSSGAAHTLDVMPVLGAYLAELLNNLEALLAAAAITVITVIAKDRLTE